MANWKKVITTADDADYKNSNISGLKQKVDMQWSMRWYTSAYTSAIGSSRRRWYHPSTTYGPAYYNWNSSAVGADSRTIWYDTYNPCIVVPRDMTLTGYKLYGNMATTNSGDLILDLKKNTNAITWDNDNGTQAISLVSNRVTTAWTGNCYNSMGESGISVAMSEGDILIPMMCRDYALTTSSQYMIEGVFHLEFEEELT